MINLSNLKDNTRVDIVTKGNNVYHGWWVYNAKCGYFTRSQNTMVDGMIYAESIKSVKVYKDEDDDNA